MMDADGDGLVSKQEFIFRTRRVMESGGTLEEEEILPALQRNAAHFDEADLNQDGRLNLQEVEYLGYLGDLRQAKKTRSFDYDSLAEKLFDAVDADQDGSVSEAEFLGVLSAGGLDVDIVDETFKACDLDGDNSLDRHELQFASWRTERLLGTKESNAKDPIRDLAHSLYRLWDADKDGVLTFEELISAAEIVVSQRGFMSPIIPIALEKALEHFRDYDFNGNGKWDPEEAAYFAGHIVDHYYGDRNDGP